MRAIGILLIAILALALVSCADMQASWEAGTARARAAAAAANDSCRFAVASSFHRDPIRHTLTYTGHEVCATPESIADYDRRGKVIAYMCSAGSCWRNAEETQFTPGVCEVYEDLATRSGQGRLGGSHRVDVKELYLTQTQKYGAIIAYHKHVDKFDEEYASGSALDASEMFALEAHVRCQDWYQELAQEREHEEKARQEATRREQERQQAVAQQRYLAEQTNRQQVARAQLPSIRSTCERYTQGYDAHSWRGFLCEIRKRDGKPEIAWHFNSQRRFNQFYSAYQEYVLVNRTFCDAYGEGRASVTIRFPHPSRPNSRFEKSEDC